MAGNPEVLIVGHLGFETVETPGGSGNGLGGSAYYAGVAAAISAAQVVLCSTVGTDFPLAELVDVGIDVSGVSIVPGRSPQFTIRYLPTYENRHVDFDLGVGASIDVSRVNNLGDIRYAHVATNLPSIQLLLARQLRSLAPHACLSVECFDQFIVADAAGVARVLGEVDMAFANARELELLQMGHVRLPERLVAKLGERGVMVSWSGGRVSVTAPSATVVDPTGAGDVFAGAFLAHLSRGHDYAEASRAACALASTVVQGYSATSILRQRTQRS